MRKASKMIRKLRHTMGIDQTEFGYLIDKSKQTVWHYEQGSRRPTLDTIKIIIGLAKKHEIKLKMEDFIK